MTAVSFRERARSWGLSLASKTFGSMLFAAGERRYVPIFMLHRMQQDNVQFSGHPTELLERCLDYLRKNGYSVVSIDQLCAAIYGKATIPRRSVVFTCDDGFADQLEIAAPVFEKYRCPVSIFLLTDFVDGKSWPWDYKVQYVILKSDVQEISLEPLIRPSTFTLAGIAERKRAINEIRKAMKKMAPDEIMECLALLSQRAHVPLDNKPPEEYRGISWSAARARESEFVRFGAHAARHIILGRQSLEVCRYEIRQSQKRLNEELKHPSRVFCYPTGNYGIDFGEREMEIVRDCGFHGAISTNPGYVDLKADGNYPNAFKLPRFGFPGRLSDFIQYCGWIERIKENIRSRS